MGYAEKNLAPNEKILFRARYHWVFYRFSITVFVLAVALAIAALYAKSNQASDEVGRPLAWVAAAFVAIALATFAMMRFRANLDEFVVTSRRVIRKVGIFAREVQQAPIEKIQDITIEQGILGRLLGYGTVIVQTASETGMLVFPSVAKPDGFRNHIWGQPPPKPDVPETSAVVETPAAAAASTATSVPAARARLEELESLKQQGLVTPEEYAAKRQQILSNL
jgi:membrane protein YdbS with pleckstrin-like domain